MTTLLPRLPLGAFEGRFQEIASLDPEHAPDSLVAIECNGRIYGQTGGARLKDSEIRDLRERILLAATIARNEPNRRGAVFDQQCTRILVDTSYLDSPDASRDEFWSYLAAAVLPDLVLGRFGAQRERFCGGVRNCFQRLWRRGRTLAGVPGDSARWILIDSLTEDAFVAIFERTRLSPSNLLCREIASAWLRAANKYGRGNMEQLHREMMKAVSLIRQTRNLECLSEAELAKIFDDLYAITRKRLIS